MFFHYIILLINIYAEAFTALCVSGFWHRCCQKIFYQLVFKETVRGGNSQTHTHPVICWQAVEDLSEDLGASHDFFLYSCSNLSPWHLGPQRQLSIKLIIFWDFTWTGGWLSFYATGQHDICPSKLTSSKYVRKFLGSFVHLMLSSHFTL